jgi:hypothetical protein
MLPFPRSAWQKILELAQQRVSIDKIKDEAHKLTQTLQELNSMFEVLEDEQCYKLRDSNYAEFLDALISKLKPLDRVLTLMKTLEKEQDADAKASLEGLAGSVKNVKDMIRLFGGPNYLALFLDWIGGLFQSDFLFAQLPAMKIYELIAGGEHFDFYKYSSGLWRLL